MAAEAAISSAVELLGNLLIQKVKSLRGVEGNIQSLKEELEWMQSFLKEANKRQAGDEGVRNWIKKIREVAQDAEDTIEIFLVNVENAKNRGLLERCTTFPKRMYHLDRIGHEIESIRARLDAIDKSRERYGIKDFSESAAAEPAARRLQVESRRRLSPLQKDEHLVGIEDDVEKLLRESILDEEKKGLSVAVVEGMGGIGKSTLAREIYNHRQVVAGRFECCGWVVVSSEFTPRETIKQLILELPDSDKRKLREVEETTGDELYLLRKLQEMLHQQLQGKTYFIVLDDVWEKEHWEYLRTAFPNEQDKTSRLLLTTRNNVIGKYCQYVHKMNVLDSEKSWELLLKKAFIGSVDGNCTEELESIGRQILEKCHGLPLAIRAVGGLLVETQTHSGWKEVLNQMNSYLGRAESSVSTILELSYHNLSPQLKSCFLCLAFFKEDATIPAKRLINIWVGQGLIQQEGSRTIDEIGRGYLNELINRSMVQVEDVIIDNHVENCRLHDLLREICLRRAKEEICLEIVKWEERISSESSYKPRHRVVYGKNLETSSRDHNKYLRSLFLLNVNGDSNVYMSTPSHYWKSFQLLKMLDLDGFAFQRLPRSIRLLTGLKCLRIHKSHNIFRDVLGSRAGWITLKTSRFFAWRISL
ncbi:putative disease resistance protein At1g50180 isoform X2 [Salvia miltiorrhiza]|uniref:putative disease resistance protein At1g50180 isoform X2 n=1 Tax=Salvia miltiorrhiza TaxID=226208 RepID=UPI0025AC5D31|nr:putative disease resistance protein At1g50180 isoform X2 [Salvia miltiorrhiza]